jgi:hypothetical protein
MLRSIKEMLNYSILATDGEIGTISDVLVGDSDLKLRYLVIAPAVGCRGARFSCPRHGSAAWSPARRRWW